MFSWTMVFYMVFKLSTIIESDQKHFLHSRMWVFVAWCMSCGLWHSSPAHIFYWNGVPRPRYGSAQCSMAVKLLNDLGRLNSLWRRNQYGEAGILPHVNAILVFWRTSVSIEHGNHVAGKLAKEVQLPARPPTHPKKPKHQCLRRPCYLSVMNSQARRKKIADIDIRGLTDTGRALPRAQQLPTKIGSACVWDSRISMFSNLPKRLSPRGPRGTLRHSAVTEKKGMSEILTSSGHIFSDDT